MIVDAGFARQTGFGYLAAGQLGTDFGGGEDVHRLGSFFIKHRGKQRKAEGTLDMKRHAPNAGIASNKRIRSVRK
ncbi:hypothetical protein MASR1M36_08830 [Candidatus Cloacimonadaceae bacterium]